MLKKSRNNIRNFFNEYIVVGKFDVVFLAIVIVLTGIGVVMMYSASYVFAENEEGSPQAYFYSQVAYAVVGFVAMFILSKINYKFYYQKWFVISSSLIAIGLICVALVTGSGDVIKRWFTINLGFYSFSVQPSEIAKLVMIIGLAYMICKMQQRIQSKNFTDNVITSAIMAIYIFVFAGLIALQSHYSCMMLILFLGMSMMWLSGAKKWQFILVITVATVAAIYLIMYVDAIDINDPDTDMHYALERIKVWLVKAEQIQGERTTAESAMILGSRYQTIQSLRAIGSGGLTGVGFTLSTQKYLYIPEPQNDFIFAIVCEELGFIGAVAILCVFMFLIYRGFKIAINCQNRFASLIVMGIILQVGIQLFLNIAVVTDLIPNTGIGLPFFSYGGTALIMILAEMGIVLSISRSSYIEKR